MTSTTAGVAGQGTDHERPCFCEVCAYVTVDELVDDYGKLLDGALTDRLYTDGFERQLAEQLIEAIPLPRREAILEYMLEWDHLEPRVMIVACLLDECETSSYDALAEMARILLDAIHTQGSEGHALWTLVVNAICAKQKSLENRRRYGW